ESPWRYLVLHPGQTIYLEAGTTYVLFRLQNTPTLMFGGHGMQWTRIGDWVKIMQEQMRNAAI
ncbi:hypothetical protein P153DRAFT_255453, partial [Dothidotthia symphoricarpi CBS 119687]